MDDRTSQLATVMELEARHDELLRRLSELDREVQQVLAEWRAETLNDER